MNVPKRGIGKTTIQRLTDAANQLGIPLWDIISDQEAVRSLGGRSSKGVLEFSEIINYLKDQLNHLKPSELIQLIIEKSGYLKQLIQDSTDISEERRRNLQELINAAIQYEEESDEANIEGFLSSAALSSDMDNKDLESKKITLMTLHSSKGLEFQIVSLVGMEQGLFPSYRSLNDSSALEEERRLCYVGLTRAKERLFLYHANERRLWGGIREPAIPSNFLGEIPAELLEGDIPLNGGTAIRREERLKRLTRVDRNYPRKVHSYQSLNIAQNAVRKTHSGPEPGKYWKVGDLIKHYNFGEGTITHTFGSGEKTTIAVKFEGMGPKIIDPRLAPIEKLDQE
tara:strand:- start:251 stop:1273 length:1023 start_codon:yes stop_codon:yes gene_type:complete